MGQKVNPHGLRVGVIKGWDTRWYADKTYKDFLGRPPSSAELAAERATILNGTPSDAALRDLRTVAARTRLDVLAAAQGGEGFGQMREALRRRRILTVPGSGFYGPGHIRIAYCVDDATILGSIAGLGEALKEFR